MKNFFLAAALFFAPHVALAYDEAIFSRLAQECCKQVDKEHKADVAKAFHALYTLSQDKKPIGEFLNNKSIQNLLGVTSSFRTNKPADMIMYSSQKLLLARMYIQFFQEYIKSMQVLSVSLAQAKEYWKQELFYESLPLHRKNITRWSHDKAYRSALAKRIQILQGIEDKMCSVLGITLYGYHEISKIYTIDSVHLCVSSGILPLYQYYNIPVGDLDSNLVSANRLFQDTKWFADRAQEDMKSFAQTIEQHKKPHHIVRHKVAYGLALGAVILGACTYKKYEDQVPYYQKKGKDILDNFIKDYIVDAAAAVKKYVWEQNGNIIKKLPTPDHLAMREVLLPGISQKDPLPQIDGLLTKIDYTGISDNLNKQRLAVNQWISSSVDDANKNTEAASKYISAEANGLKQYVNQTTDVTVKAINDIGEIVNRDGKVTLFMVAVFPTVGLGCGAYYLGRAGYNRFIKHDTWYKPMSDIVRSMDILLNKIIHNKQRSFCDDGKLHLLIFRLKSYMYCLSNDELYLFKDDISQLLSFDLSYEQKHSVLERMHKTYEFLK